MEKSLFEDLERGDIIKHKMKEQTYVVSGNYGEHVIAITSVHMSNPSEWDLVLKANHTRPETSNKRIEQTLKSAAHPRR